MAHRGRHAADLAVFAFDEFEGEPGVGDVFADADGRIAWRQSGRGIEQARGARQCAVVVERDATAGETDDGVGGRDAFDLRPVFAAVCVFRIEQTRVQARLVAEEQEAFRVGVEAAEGVNVFG